MRVEITCSDRVGILQEIMAVFADFRINVRTGEIGGDSGDKVYLWAPGLLITQFQSIEKALQRVTGVRKVRRIDLIPSERRHFELDTLLRHVADPVLSVDPEGRIIAANLAAARAFGVSLEQAPGMQLQRFLPRLQLEELLRGLTAPRYGFPVAVRGRPYTLDWSPITLDDAPGAVASLAGAVLTLQPRAASAGETTAQVPPEPQVLWDLDLRRHCCLQLQQLAPLSAPLLILGERGSGKTTFLNAAYYLSPLVERGRVYRCCGEELNRQRIEYLADLSAETVVLLDDLNTVPVEVQRHLAEMVLQRHFRPRLILTATQLGGLAPAVQQLFSGCCIQLPPLRAMRPAIARFCALMVDQISRSASETLGTAWQGGEPDTISDQLKLMDWPTNFIGLEEQLRAAIAHLRARGGAYLSIDDFSAVAEQGSGPVQESWSAWGRGLTLAEQMEKVERGVLEELLQSQPKRLRSSRALARRLGISHTAVANKLRKYGLAD